MDTKEAEKFLKDNASPRLKVQIETGVVTPIAYAEVLDVRPQMIYGYIRTGRIAARKTPDTQKLVIDFNVAVDFAAKYLTDRQEREEKREAKLAAELAGETVVS